MEYYLKGEKGVGWFLPVLENKCEEMRAAIINHTGTFYSGMREDRVLEMFEDLQERAENLLETLESMKSHHETAQANIDKSN